METLKPLIDQLVKMIQQGTDIVSGQLPDVAKQLLAYNAWSYHFWLWICIWAIVALILLAVLFAISDVFPLSGLCVIAIMAFMLAAFYNYDQLNEIRLAPKVFLIEQLTSMVKK